MTASYKAQHGDYHLRMVADVMLVRAVGAANLECIENIGRDYMQLIMAKQLSQWAELTMLEGECLLVPEAEKQMKSQLPLLAQAGLAHVAVILEKCTVKLAVKKRVREMYENTSVTLKMFESIEEATEWLQTCGYSIDHSSSTQFLCVDER